MKRYNIPFENWNEIHLPSAKFILNEAKEYIQYLVKESDLLTQRTFSFTKILITVCLFLIGLLISTFQAKEYNITALVMFTVIDIIFALSYFIKLLFPRLFMPIGRSPKELESPGLYGLDKEMTKEESELALVLNEIENCQNKIEFNENQNRFRTEKLEEAINFTFKSLIGLIAVFLIFAGAILILS